MAQLREPGCAGGRGLVAVKRVVQTNKERFKGTVLLTAILVVEVAWGASLVYLAVHFL